ncbi:MAG: hypoxanthine-guanine phosphoribosyltransferase [Gammaproteobacteria bacterium]
MLNNEVKHVLETADLIYDAPRVERAIDAMAEKINLRLSDRNPLLLCVVNGGIVTAGKLLTRLSFPLTVEAIKASRYRNRTSGGDIEWLLKPNEPLADRTILIVDDILDEGITLHAIYEYCLTQGAASVYSAVLVDKLLDRPKPVQADFVGVTAENRYLFGYGMDYKGYLRNAPGIYACRIE